MNDASHLIMTHVRAHADRTPSAIALIEGERSLSYRELVDEVEAVASALIGMGVRPGDRVATLAPPCIAYVTSFLATLSCGAVWVGLNPRYSYREIAHVLADATPSALLAFARVSGRDYASELERIKLEHPGVRTIVKLDDDSERAAFLAHGVHAAGIPEPDSKAPCLIVYTSGSTGKPKGALLHQTGLVACALEQNERWPVSPLRTLNYFPINHVGCVADVTCPTLIGGGTMVLMPQFDPDGALGLIAHHRLTIWGSVPAVLKMQLDLPTFRSHDLSAVQLIVWEGGAASPELIAQLLAVHPRLATNFSMTESTCAITLVEPTDDPDTLANSVGHPARDVDVRILDESGASVPDGVPGELCFKGPGLMLGYWNRPDLNTEIFTSDGHFRTGDLALRRPDGTYRIVGRLKDMIKSGGYNIYPREIEALLESWPGVGLAAVVGAPDDKWGEAAVAFVTPNSDAGVDETRLLAHLRANLANYKVPKRLIVQPELPLLPIGKVDKSALKSMAAEIMSGS